MSCIYFYYEANNSVPVILLQQDSYSLVTVTNLAERVKSGTRIYVEINGNKFATNLYGKSA